MPTSSWTSDATGNWTSCTLEHLNQNRIFTRAKADTESTDLQWIGTYTKPTHCRISTQLLCSRPASIHGHTTNGQCDEGS